MIPLEKLKQHLHSFEKENLFSLATLSASAIRRYPENIPFTETTYRLEFAIDADRILHAAAYTRYMGKTQVFTFPENDMISYRLLHVQLVSKIARTIGRYLELNTDLIEAIALGHDIGHPPFGHMGEYILSEICKKMDIGPFHHNCQSLRFLDRIEKKGDGLNLTFQVLDGILSHDGEKNVMMLKPDFTIPPTFEQLNEKQAKLNQQEAYDSIPTTLEGCVTRLSDTIAYIGRDIEDAIRLNLIQRSDLPREITKTLMGDTNGTIVHTLVTDLIRSSYHRSFIGYSEEIGNALFRLKQFNYERIYHHPILKKQKKQIEKEYQILFTRYLNDIQHHNAKSVIYTDFLDHMDEKYQQEPPPILVRDFIAGMTDRYFRRQISFLK